MFRAIAENLNKPFLNYHINGSEPGTSESDGSFIMLNYHSRFDDGDAALLALPNKVLHMYRDPRDVIISAAHYHAVSTEEWLHRPKKEFKGKSYQEQLNSIDDSEEKFLFEMKHASKRVIEDMERWDYGMQNCIDVKYEDLIEDRRLRQFSQIFRSLGFEKNEMVTCRTAARKFSLFGKMSKRKNAHIRSGRARQWEQVFTPDLADAFDRQFPTALQTLGYEANNSWVTRCGDTPNPNSIGNLLKASFLPKWFRR